MRVGQEPNGEGFLTDKNNCTTVDQLWQVGLS